MCGIVGFIGKKQLGRLSDLLLSIEHRGRDERVLFYQGGMHLGMNRLAVIDLTRGLYPMRYKQYFLVFNGEIYNHIFLKKQLSSQGVIFTTSCDAEVILPLFDLYGVRAFSMLEGMFALSIFDTQKKQLILSRDKSGEKPLYFSNDGHSFMFSSELKTLLDKKKKHKLNTDELNQYFHQGFIFAPDTLVKGIMKVPASGFVVFDVLKKSISKGSYWDPAEFIKTRTTQLDEQASCSKIDMLLRNAVSSRLISDVPIGCFLSGGIDSSLVTFFAAQKKSNLRTYSVAFPGHEKEDESIFSRFVANKLQTNHTEVSCTPYAIIALLEKIGEYIDEPIIDPAILPTLLMAKEARKDVTVVLTGEGADELFGGYERYRRELYLNQWNTFLFSGEAIRGLWQAIFPKRFSRIRLPLIDRYSAQRVWSDSEVHSLLKYPISPLPIHDYMHAYGKSNPLLAMQLTDFRGYMSEQLLMKIDKSTMAANLEARAPYLDSELLSFALSLPNQYKIRGSNGKYLLKKVASKYFPRSFVYRKKHGFDIPLSTWFRQDLRPFVDESVTQLSNYNELFAKKYYKKIVDEHMRGSQDHGSKIWSIIVLLKWITKYSIQV